MSWHGVIIPTTDRADWLTKRSAGIGASDVAGIVGLSPWSTPFTVWAEKKLGYSQDPTEAMTWGQKLENVVIDEYEERTGIAVDDRQLLVHHPGDEWMMATLDGVAYESHDDARDDHERKLGALGNVEVKTDSQWGRWGDVPDHYQIQVQWQMYVDGLEHAWVVVLHGGRNFEVYEMAQDSRVQQSLVAKASEFRDRYILGDEEPDADASDLTSRILSDLWKGEGDEVELPAELAVMWEGLPALEDELKRLAAEVTKRKNQMRAWLGDNTVGSYGGVPVVTWKGSPRKAYWVEAKENVRVLRRVNKKKEK